MVKPLVDGAIDQDPLRPWQPFGERGEPPMS
jgi:hypothetical protein